MEIGNGTLRKSAKKRQRAPSIFSRRGVRQQLLANAQESAVENWEPAMDMRTRSVSEANADGVLAIYKSFWIL